MEDVLIAILENFGFPVYRQGAMSNDAIYPETFITYWNNSSPDHSHYDNAGRGTAWNYTVNVYSEDSAEAYRLIGEIRSLRHEPALEQAEKIRSVFRAEAARLGGAAEITVTEDLRLCCSTGGLTCLVRVCQTGLF